MEKWVVELELLLEEKLGDVRIISNGFLNLKNGYEFYEVYLYLMIFIGNFLSFFFNF